MKYLKTFGDLLVEKKAEFLLISDLQLNPQSKRINRHEKEKNIN